jgi:hypothetical protein
MLHAVEPSNFQSHPLDHIVRAATASGTWLRPTEVRRVTVLLAPHQGCRDTKRIAERLGITERQVQRLSLPRDGDASLVEPAPVCLGSEMLTRFWH